MCSAPERHGRPPAAAPGYSRSQRGRREPGGEPEADLGAAAATGQIAG